VPRWSIGPINPEIFSEDADGGDVDHCCFGVSAGQVSYPALAFSTSTQVDITIELNLRVRVLPNRQGDGRARGDAT
jgi:hypothetical protein